MKITRRQLRQIIKEETGIGPSKINENILALMKALEQEQERERFQTSEMPDYPESDLEAPYQVTQQEFEDDNQKEIKMLTDTMRPLALNFANRALAGLAEMGLVDAISKSELAEIYDEMSYDLASATLYKAVMGKDARKIQDVLDGAKKLASGGTLFDDLLDELQMAMTSDSETGEPIIDRDAMKAAAQAFKDAVMGMGL